MTVTIRDEFLEAGLNAELQDLWLYSNMPRKQYQRLACRDPNIDFLLASSRKALVFVEENEINTVAKPLLRLKRKEILDKPYPDKLAMLPTLLHAYSVLLRQSRPIETRYVLWFYWDTFSYTYVHTSPEILQLVH